MRYARVELTTRWRYCTPRTVWSRTIPNEPENKCFRSPPPQPPKPEEEEEGTKFINAPRG